MRKLIVCSLVALLLAGTGVSCSPGGNEGPDSDAAFAAPGGSSTAGAFADLPGAGGAADGSSDKMKDVSYCIGFGAGMNMARQGLGLAPDEFVEGFRAGFGGSGSRMTEAEMQEVMTAFEREMMSKQSAAMEGRGAEAQKAGESFLAENKTKEGVVTTDSGLQYKIIKPGEGKQPGRDDEVTVDYRGTLLDGTVFDSSYDRGQPAEFQVGGVIPGWTEALLLMKEGCEWELYIPAELAYGPRGAGGAIGPNETLIFKVELRKVGAAPGSETPASDPPAEDKPAADPPAEEKPAADPPAEKAPAADPPADDAPAADPPADGEPAKDTADPAPKAAEE